MKKSWHLSRRTFLCGSGVSLALPALESMAWETGPLPRRFCGIYFPFGVSLPPKGHEEHAWNWFPDGEGSGYTFTNVLKGLEPLRKKVSIFHGLSHPRCRSLGGHDTGDTWLTGAKLEAPLYKNTISLDQLAAARIGGETRFSSLTLSSDGGVGEPTRSTTLSFSHKGHPIPALSRPRQIFARLFGVEEGESAGESRRKLADSTRMLDRVLEHARTMKGKLGREDRRKLEEYLASVRDVEKEVERSRRWLEIPKPKVASDAVNQDASPQGPKEYLRTMYDLMALAFQTDSTRIATYMIGQVAGATTIANAFPAEIGLKGNWHGLAHGAGKKGGAEALGRFDQYLAEQLGYFLKKLDSIREGDGTLLDRTMVLYGSSNSKTHNNHNYPLLLAGGSALGLKHGRFLSQPESVPFANLLVTILGRLETGVDAFADSTGPLTEIL